MINPYDNTTMIGVPTDLQNRSAFRRAVNELRTGNGREPAVNHVRHADGGNHPGGIGNRPPPPPRSDARQPGGNEPFSAGGRRAVDRQPERADDKPTGNEPEKPRSPILKPLLGEIPTPLEEMVEKSVQRMRQTPLATTRFLLAALTTGQEPPEPSQEAGPLPRLDITA